MEAFTYSLEDHWLKVEGTLDWRQHSDSSFSAGDYVRLWRDGQGKLHRDEGPAVIIVSAETGKVISEKWFRHGLLHRDGDQPALTELHTSGATEFIWAKEGLVHRENRPARVVREPDGSSNWVEQWRLRGEFHRVGGPAVIYVDPDSGVVNIERWCENGRSHRPDGPAEIERDETTGVVRSEDWYLNGNPVQPRACRSLSPI